MGHLATAEGEKKHGRFMGRQHSEGRASARPLGSPNQFIHFALVWPIFGTLNQIMPNRIPAYILPLLMVGLFTSKLPIPMALLPDGSIVRIWPSTRHERLPVLHPLLQGAGTVGYWTAKKVHVV